MRFLEISPEAVLYWTHYKRLQTPSRAIFPNFFFEICLLHASDKDLGRIRFVITDLIEYAENSLDMHEVNIYDSHSFCVESWNPISTCIFYIWYN